MMIVIGNALDTHETAALREAAEKLEYEDGKRTAGRYARNVKSNLQAVASPGLETIFTKVRDTLNGNEVFRSAARPKKFARLLLSRYRGGMTYGTHVDDPVMMGSRTDLSFTLALSDPGEYDGGERRRCRRRFARRRFRRRHRGHHDALGLRLEQRKNI